MGLTPPVPPPPPRPEIDSPHEPTKPGRPTIAPPVVGAQPWWRMAALSIPEAPASMWSKAAVFGVVCFSFAMIGQAGGQWPWAIGASVILATSILVVSLTPVRHWFDNFHGLFAGALASAFVLLVVSIMSTVGAMSIDGDVLLALVLGVGLFVAGLDWTRVHRLRIYPPLSGMVMLIVLTSGDDAWFVPALAWLALATIAFWALERDQRRAYADPRRLNEGALQRREANTSDLVGATAIALLIGLLFAFSATMPSCSIPGLKLPGAVPSLPNGPDMTGLGRLLTIDDLRLGRFPFDFSGSVPQLDLNGERFRLREGASGLLYLENTLTGERLSLEGRGETIVVRDMAGNVVAILRPADEPPGDNQRDRRPLFIGLALIAGALAALAIWWRWGRRRPSPAGAVEWAEEMVRRTDRFGRSHKVPRRRNETVLHHTARLAQSVAPDPRLADAGRVVSDALFGREVPAMDVRIRAEQVLDEVNETYRPPSRLRRTRPPQA